MSVFRKLLSTYSHPGKSPASPAAKLWFILSVSALLIAGFLSLSFIIGRAPVLSSFITDPMWIKRVLIVHVDLALLIFIYGFFCGLFLLIPSESKSSQKPVLAAIVAISAMVILLSTIFIPSASPILSNYIPVLDHPVFVSGLLLFGAAVVLVLLSGRLFMGHQKLKNANASIFPTEAVPGLQASAFILIVSALTFLASWWLTYSNLSAHTFYELAIWGGGHQLQFANSAIMASVWLILGHKLLGKSIMSYKLSLFWFAVFALPIIVSPLLLMEGTSSPLYLGGFTTYMRWGIFPVISVLMVIITTKLAQAKAKGDLPKALSKNPYFTGLTVSLSFMVIGFILGSLIRGSNTLIPAHYHATLGAITVAFTTITYYLLDRFGNPFPSKKTEKWAAYQPLIFGVGQLMFVFGFAYAGSYGLARKAFGPEQNIESVQAFIGLAVAGTGGLIAITGGFIFLWVIISCLKNAPRNGLSTPSVSASRSE